MTYKSDENAGFCRVHATPESPAVDLNPDKPCPACGASDLGDVIPPEVNRNECYGPQGSRWRRHIGIEDPLIYDGISWWKCCECAHIWKRFSDSPEPPQC